MMSVSLTLFFVGQLPLGGIVELSQPLFLSAAKEMREGGDAREGAGLKRVWCHIPAFFHSRKTDIRVASCWISLPRLSFASKYAMPAMPAAAAAAKLGVGPDGQKVSLAAGPSPVSTALDR